MNLYSGGQILIKMRSNNAPLGNLNSDRYGRVIKGELFSLYTSFKVFFELSLKPPKSRKKEFFHALRKTFFLLKNTFLRRVQILLSFTNGAVIGRFNYSTISIRIQKNEWRSKWT